MTAPADFKPLFNRVSQGDDRHADILAVLATVSGCSLQQIRQQAEVFGVPQTGPYHAYTADGDLIAKVLTSRGLVGKVWKECKDFKSVDEVSLCLVAYDQEWEIGRAVLYHRLPADHPSKVPHYVIDPYPHADNKLHVRTTLDGLTPAWFIGISQAPTAATTTAKPKGK